MPTFRWQPKTGSALDIEANDENHLASIINELTLQGQNIDQERGAPAAVRGTVGMSMTPQDRLATMQKFYPEAQPFKDDNFIFNDRGSGRPTLYNPPGFDMGDVASIAPEAAEFAGGSLAGAMATPPALAVAIPTGGASLLGIPAAVGLGAAGGREIASLAGRAAGAVDTRPTTTRLLDAGTTAGVNAVGWRAGDLLGKAVNAVAGPVKRAFQGVDPTRAIPDFRMTQVTPTAGAATGNRAVQTIESALTNLPGSQSVMQRAAEKSLEEMDTAANRIAGDFSTGGRGGQSRVLTQQGTGGKMKQAAEGYGDRFAATRKTIDDQLAQEIGPDTLVPVANVRKLVTDLEGELANAPASRAPVLEKTLERARAVIADASPTRNAAGQATSGAGIPFKALRQIRTDTGLLLENPDVSGYSPPGLVGLRKFYGSLAEDIKAAATTAGPKAEKLLTLHDRYVRFNRNVNLPALQRIADAGTDEQAFRVALAGAKDGGSQLMAMRRTMKPEEWDVVSGSVLQKLGRAKAGAQEASGIADEADNFSPGTFLTNWSNLSKEAKVALFGGNRYDAIAPELDALVRTAGRLKDAQKMANPSGTARNSIAALTVLGVGSQLLQGDVEGGATVLGSAILAPRMVAKLLTNPRFVNWLANTAQSTMAHSSNIAPRIGMLAGIAKAEPAIREEIYQYVDALRSFDGQD